MRKAAVCLTLLILAPAVLPAAGGYVQHNFVADVPGAADFTDPNLVNAWGISFSATGPFWLCDGGTGLSTVYTYSATAFSVSATKVAIPPSAVGANTVCTGQVYNSTTSFLIGPAPGTKPNFIFATEGGTISAWASAVDATHALMEVDNSTAGAVYKGLAIVTTPTPQLYAANFHAGTIDVFDVNYKPVSLAGAFTDPLIPSGFAPFNIQNLNGKLYVTYAKQDAAAKFDVPGVGNGYVDIYDTTGKLLQHFIAGGLLNSPWGIQIAPANFGQFSNAFVVGNFGDGLINAYDASTGAFLGTLQDPSGNTIRIPGLWGLQFGNGGSGGDVNALFFAAGPSAQKHGLFGSLQAPPVISNSSVVNAAGPQAGISANTLITIYGANMSATTRGWQTADFKNNNLPVSLDGVTVTLNGKPAYVSFISPKQINALTTADLAMGPVQVQTVNNGSSGNSATLQSQAYAPAFFLYKSDKYVAALHPDNISIVGPATLYPNLSTPAKPGETVVMFGTGFGGTTPAFPVGQLVTAAAPLAIPAFVLINNEPAEVDFEGLVSAGLYQLNVRIPGNAPDGDLSVVALVGGASSPVGLITVQH